MPEPEPEPMPEPEPEPEPDLGGPDDEGGGLSAAELDEMFGDDDEPGPIASVVDDGGADIEPDVMDPDELEDLPDPDPIPQVFTASESGDDGEVDSASGGKRKLMIILLVVVLFFGALFGALIGLKSTIIGMFPAARGVYDMIGLSGDPFAGLAIQKVKSERGNEQGQEVLVVRGVVANVSDDPRTVPLVKVMLFDAEGNVIQEALAAPFKNQLEAKARVNFTARLVAPSPLARRVEVTFTLADEQGGQAR